MWIDIIWQGFLANLFFPLQTESLYYATLKFGKNSPLLPFICALAGALVAALCNLFVGHVIAHGNMQKEAPSFLRIQRIANRYLVWVLALPGLGALGLVTVVFAAAGVSVKRAFLALCIGQGLAYALSAFVTKRSDLWVALLTN